MDALSGRHQTTKGIWLARAPRVPAPPTLVLDLEGSDGRERGEDDTSFERQSALFAVGIAGGSRGTPGRACYSIIPPRRRP